MAGKLKPKRRGRATVMVTRASPYGNGVEVVELAIDTDPLEHMAYRRQITPAEKQAGDRFKRAFIAVSGSSRLGIDYTREKVDTSGVNQDLHESVIRGMEDMTLASETLGKTDFAIMCRVAGEGWSITDFAARVSDGGQQAKRYLGQRFRDALHELAIVWNYERASQRKYGTVAWASADDGIAYPPTKATVGAYVHDRDKVR